MASWKLALRRPRRPALYSTRNHRNYTPLRWQDQPPRNYIRFLFWDNYKTQRTHQEDRSDRVTPRPHCLLSVSLRLCDEWEVRPVNPGRGSGLHALRAARPAPAGMPARMPAWQAGSLRYGGPGARFCIQRGTTGTTPRFGGKINHQETTSDFCSGTTIRRRDSENTSRRPLRPRHPLAALPFLYVSASLRRIGGAAGEFGPRLRWYTIPRN